MTGPTLRTYKAGSIIYFNGDRGSEVYVLQKGRISLISSSLDHSTEVREDVQRGEFFGVKSAMGNYPREETAQVLADSMVLAFTPQAFEGFCLKNPRLVLQMLKVFSGQLRKVHRKVREVLGETGEQENSIELINTAEYFFKQGMTDHASYAYQAFLKNYPSSPLVARAKRMVDLLERGGAYPSAIKPVLEELSELTATEMMADVSGGDFGSVPDLQELGSTDDDFDLLNEEIDLGDIGGSSGATKSITELYYDGLNEFSKENWDEAISIYESILSKPTVDADHEEAIVEKALYELGRSCLKKGEVKKAFEKFSEFVKKYPRSSLVKKAMMSIGEIYEKKNDKSRAAGIYQKVLKMPPKDKETSAARQKLEMIAT